MLSLKKYFFSNFLFLIKIRVEIRFNNILKRKQTLFDYKNKHFQSPKNRIFPKGLTHAFGQKIHFCFNFFIKIRLKIRFNNVLKRKQTLFDYKNKHFQSPKNRIFPKGLTHAFSQKIHFCFNFFGSK